MNTQQPFVGCANGSSSNWTAFASGDSIAREAILAENLSLVHHVARQLERKLSNQLDHDELVSAGTLGLMSAMDGYDPDRGLAFSTFAVPRIRGSILDELRRQDHVPRSVRRKSRDIAAARDTLGREFGRMPKAREVAASLGVEVQELWRWELDIEGANQFPIDERANDIGNDSESARSLARVELLMVDPTDTIDEELNREQEEEILRQAMMKLNEQERSVLFLCFFEELTLLEVADIFELTESRVSQIRTKALSRLREALTPIMIGTGSEPSQVDLAWEELNKSGALDEEDDLSELMRYDE
jgi:RNA polymerase sigma factor for flagellar operon FliA